MIGTPESLQPNPEQFASDLRQLWNFQVPAQISVGDDDKEVWRKQTDNLAHWFNSEVGARSEAKLRILLEPIEFTESYKQHIQFIFILFTSSFSGIELSHTPIDELLVGKGATDPETARKIEEDALGWYLSYEKLPGERKKDALGVRHTERYIKGGKTMIQQLEAKGIDCNAPMGMFINLEKWDAEFVQKHGYTPRIERDH